MLAWTIVVNYLVIVGDGISFLEGISLETF